MPLIPPTAVDVLNAPIPFIAGLTSKAFSHFKLENSVNVSNDLN
jgi:hypothetical protein